MEDKIISEKVVRPPETNGQKPLTVAGSPVTSLGDSGIWEDLEEDEETKNNFSFNGTGLKT
jgi:hypothetical protein